MGHLLSNLVAKTRRAVEDRNLRMLLLTNFFRIFSMSMINPITPLFISSLGAETINVSLVLSASSAASIFLSVPSGLLADRYGRKKTIVISIVLSIIPPIFFSLSTHWEQIIPWAILLSISATMYFPAKDSIIADYTTPENRAMFYGAINMAFSAAYIIAPVTGGFIVDHYGWTYSFYFIILTAMLSLISASNLSETTGEGIVCKEGKKIEAGKERYLLTLTFFITYYLLLGIAIAMVLMAIPLYLDNVLNMSKTQIGLFFSAGMGVAPLLTQIPSGKIVKKIGGRRALFSYILMITLPLIAWPTMKSPYALLILMIAFGGAYAMTWVAESTLIMNIVPHALRGLSSAVTVTALSVGRTIGPMVGGLIWNQLGPETVFYLSALFFSLSSIPIFLLKRAEHM